MIHLFGAKKKKKQKKPYRHSIAKRLTWRIVMALLLVLGATSGISCLFAWMFFTVNSYERFSLLVNATNSKLSTVLSDVYVATVNSRPLIEQNLDKPERLYGIVRDIVAMNPRIHSCGISFRENYYPGRGRCFCPYAVRRDSTDAVECSENRAGHDYLNDDWFLDTMRADSCLWSKPFYEDDDSTTALVACMLPIHNAKGEAVAVLGVDISLGWIHDFMAKMDRKIGSVLTSNLDDDEDEDQADDDDSSLGRIFTTIIDKDGYYIAHPDKELIMKANFFDWAASTPDTIDDQAVKAMRAHEAKYFADDYDDQELVIDGHKSVLFIAPVQHVGWTTAIVVPSFYVNIMTYMFAIILVIIVLLSMVVVYLMGRFTIRRAMKPLKQLVDTTVEVAKGNFETPLPTIRHDDEVRQLRDSIGQMQHSLTEYVEELKLTTAQKASIESELTIAHNIQMSMLPKTFDPDGGRHDYSIYGMLTPAKAVGGDLFDFFLRDDKLFFCVGDVSGKGIPAALIMEVTCALLRNASAHTDSPDVIVSAINDGLSQHNDTYMFVTLFVGVLHLDTGSLDYCNAGHDAPLLVGRNVSLLPCDPNLPAGVMAGRRYSRQQALIDAQTTIFLFTDGLNEAEDASHDQFGNKRIADVANRQLSQHRHQPRPLIEAMTGAVHAFVGGAEQSDDLTMLAVQYRPED